MMLHKSFARVAALFFFTFPTVVFPQSDSPKSPEAKTPAAMPLSPTARLNAAKTVYLKNAGGSNIPFDVVSDGIQGWGRYQVVNSPAQADLVIEVTSPASDSGVSVSSTTSTNPQTGMPQSSTTTSRDLSIARIHVVVYDAKSKFALWTDTETPKSALREKDRQNNVVEAAERIVTKFRQRVEPDTTK